MHTDRGRDISTDVDWWYSLYLSSIDGDNRLQGDEQNVYISVVLETDDLDWWRQEVNEKRKRTLRTSKGNVEATLEQ
jgi:hypothetical protein